MNYWNTSNMTYPRNNVRTRRRWRLKFMSCSLSVCFTKRCYFCILLFLANLNFVPVHAQHFRVINEFAFDINEIWYVLLNLQRYYWIMKRSNEHRFFFDPLILVFFFFFFLAFSFFRTLISCISAFWLSDVLNTGL